MTLAAALDIRLRGRVVVIGVGNPWRGDDAAGCRVADRLRAGGRVRVIDAAEVPESFLGDIISARPDTAVFVDAVDLGAVPGSVAIVDLDQLVRFAPTTHHAPLALLMELVVAATGADVFVLAIQPGRLGLWTRMTADVAATADRVARVFEESLLVASARRPCAEGAS